MADQPTLLKHLLQKRHLQGHRSFCREYDRVARQVDRALVGGWPSKAQFYRWLAGELTRLPYADHCVILEKMFSGYSAEALFGSPADESLDSLAVNGSDSNGASKGGRKTLDVSQVFVNRADFAHQLPPSALFDHAKRIRSCGLSLNLLCQQYPDQKLGCLLDGGGTVECLFLDPTCDATRSREVEEAHPEGLLAALTRLNMDLLRRLRTRLSDAANERLVVKTYEGPLRFNITIIDGRLCVAQPYMPFARGMEGPTFVVERRIADVGLYDTFERTFTTLWETGRIA